MRRGPRVGWDMEALAKEVGEWRACGRRRVGLCVRNCNIGGGEVSMFPPPAIGTRLPVVVFFLSLRIGALPPSPSDGNLGSQM